MDDRLERPPIATPHENATPLTDTTPGGRRGAGARKHRLHAGRVLGNRYEIRARLGAGGMGEVWLATDLKLRTEVALKSVRSDRLASEELREILRSEVRAARAVLSPNVCRVFDLVTVSGLELVSMEYVEGVTLAEHLRSHAPLPLADARAIAAQFLAGLEAVHDASLVHRDFKPENVMITRTGRVVVMDLGIAAPSAGESEFVAGTPAYMAPEQARHEAVDARTDVFAAGVTLAEMIAAEGIRDRKRRITLWEGLRQDPPRVPESPWAAVIRKAVSPSPRDRHGSARELSRALDGVTLRVEEERGAEPYPGLVAFTAKEATRFFGREAEVEQLLRKLGRARLLALAGPSGAGKTSFLAAGLLPALPQGWGQLKFHPGDAPFSALARALSLATGGEAAVELRGPDDPRQLIAALSLWRSRHSQALVIADQFEELFTLHPPEVQARFADLVGRLPLEADVHVLVSIRDDFLMRCHDHEALAPLFSDPTPLRAPSGAALRRALVQPALSCGYRFESDELADEMLGAVEREHGALPLLAFAAARLWEKRDREQGVLGRQAYQEVGGVAGALAQHAEATLDRIGPERTPIVREIFSNLVTAQSTRAARDREELLSVFEASGSREAAGRVLDALVDARLLSSYEVGDPARHQEGSGRRIEIVHESLLSAWPRLVRWRTQQADAAQLRDQLDQAARTWDERGRPEALLWTGSAYLDFVAWRQRYSGGLSSRQEAFARAMTSQAEQRRRRRRWATAAVFLVMLGVIVAVGASRQQAVAQARRAEAGKLLALGQLELAAYPTAALAYATRALELSDSREGRTFALRALQRGPTAIVAPSEFAGAMRPAFSRDGRWLAASGFTPTTSVWSRNGSPPLLLSGHQGTVQLGFGDRADVVVTSDANRLRFWSLPAGELLREVVPVPEGPRELIARGDRMLTFAVHGGEEWVHAWPVTGGEATLLLRVKAGELGTGPGDVDATGSRVVFPRDGQLFARSLTAPSAPAELLARYPRPVEELVLHPDGKRVGVRSRGTPEAAGAARAIATRLELIDPERKRPARVFEAQNFGFDGGGAWLAGKWNAEGQRFTRLWDLRGPSGAEPIELRGREDARSFWTAFSPDSRWLVTADVAGVRFWPLVHDYGHRFRASPGPFDGLAFTPDGTRLVSATQQAGQRVWQLTGEPADQGRRLADVARGQFNRAAPGPRGERVLVGGVGGAFVLPLDGGPGRPLTGFDRRTWVIPVAFGPHGKLVAAAALRGPRADKVIRVWDLGSARLLHTLGPLDAADDGGFVGGFRDIQLTTGGELLSVSTEGLQLWNLERSTSETLIDGRWSEPRMAASADGRHVLVFAQPREGEAGKAELVHLDRATGAVQPLPAYGSDVLAVAVDAAGEVVAAGGRDGVVRVGLVRGGEPHLLYAEGGVIRAVAMSPDGRRIAAGSTDGSIHVWSTPDLSRTPFQALPREELRRALHSLTNLRTVEDATAENGYRLQPAAFPGWETVPDW